MTQPNDKWIVGNICTQYVAVSRMPIYEICAGYCLTVVKVDDQSLYDALGDRCCTRLATMAERWAK